jgi:hypothetical protein
VVSKRSRSLLIDARGALLCRFLSRGVSERVLLVIQYHRRPQEDRHERVTRGDPLAAEVSLLFLNPALLIEF